MTKMKNNDMNQLINFYCLKIWLAWPIWLRKDHDSALHCGPNLPRLWRVSGLRPRAPQRTAAQESRQRGGLHAPGAGLVPRVQHKRDPFLLWRFVRHEPSSYKTEERLPGRVPPFARQIASDSESERWTAEASEHSDRVPQRAQAADP